MIYHAYDPLTASLLDKLIVQICYGIKRMVYPTIMCGPYQFITIGIVVKLNFLHAFCCKMLLQKQVK